MADSGKGKSSEGSKGKEDYEFLPPDFDEDQFIHREIVSFRTTLILFLWGIVAAAVSWGLFAAVEGARMGWFYGLMVCAVFFLALRFLFKRFGADIKHWGRREWVGTGFLFFFTWLGVFIVAINPPVSDFAPPRVDVHVGPPIQQAGGMVNVDVFYEDNDRVATHDFRISQGGLAIADESALVQVGRGHYRYSNALPAGVYDVAASASDDNGNTQAANATVAVVETALKVFLPDNATIDSPTDQVFVQVAADGVNACTSKNRRSPCIRTVHLDIQGGGIVPLEYSKAAGGWAATSNFAGWRMGSNVFNVTAEAVDSWAGSVRIPGGDLSSGPHGIEMKLEPGSYAPKVISDPKQTARSVPGFEAVGLIVGLVAIAAVLRGRR